MCKEKYLARNKEKTVVVFRRWTGQNVINDERDNIIALFPEIGTCASLQLSYCQSYEHIGQHSSADFIYCVNVTRETTPEEYKELKTELESIGYDLDIRNEYSYL